MTPPAPTNIEEQLAFIDLGHPPGLRYRVDSACVEGPLDQVIAAARMLVEERPNDELGYTFFLFMLPREGHGDVATDGTLRRRLYDLRRSG